MQNWAERNNWGPLAPAAAGPEQSPAQFLNQLMTFMCGQQGGGVEATLRQLSQDPDSNPAPAETKEAGRRRAQPPATCKLRSPSRPMHDQDEDDDDTAVPEESEALTDHEKEVARLTNEEAGGSPSPPPSPADSSNQKEDLAGWLLLWGLTSLLAAATLATVSPSPPPPPPTSARTSRSRMCN